MQTIGFLLPRSTFYQGISFDLFQGIKSSLSTLGYDDVRVLTENIGFGTDKQLCYKCAENLIMHENAQIVFAYIGHRTAQVLRPLFAAANRLLIVLDAGAHLPQEWPVSPHIFYHSLQNALGSWLSSGLAVRNGHLSASMVTGYYDGGYLHTVGAHNGYQKAGGNVKLSLATGYQEEDFSMKPLKDQYESSESDCVLSIFSGDYVQWFFKDLQRYFSEQPVPVYLPPFAFEESMLKEAVYPGNTVSGIAAWSGKLENEKNKQFIEVITSAGREANLFSLLGWEAGMIAAFLLEQFKETPNVLAVSEKLKQFSFETPRGMVSFHAETQVSIAPLYEVKIENDGNNRCSVKIVREVADTATAYEELVSQELNNAVSGWYNSYTCI
ncbi:hypothetical protein D3C71_669930 [compost metagenome]